MPPSFLSGRASCPRRRENLETPVAPHLREKLDFFPGLGFLGSRARSARGPHANAIDDRASRRAFRAMH